MDVLSYVVVALGISIILNLLLKHLDISPIIGYIMTGTIIVYLFELQEMKDSHTLEMVGELGIVFIRFSIG
jgi:CPA2 family monovalent cation:H+ antiporter-2